MGNGSQNHPQQNQFQYEVSQVSPGTQDTSMGESLSVANGDTKYIATPHRISNWVLPNEVTQSLLAQDRGTVPDLL